MLLPPLAEQVLKLLNDPLATAMDQTILKLAATLLSEAAMGYKEFEKLDDHRLSMSDKEYFSLPDRFELRAGRKAVPKEWELPQRLAAGEESERRVKELVAQGMDRFEAIKMVYQWTDTVEKQRE